MIYNKERHYILSESDKIKTKNDDNDRKLASKQSSCGKKKS